MVECVHHVERVEFAVPLDVSGAKQIRLVDVIDAKSLSKVRVLFPFGNIGSFFNTAFSYQNPIYHAIGRKGLAPLLEFPFDGRDSDLSKSLRF